MSRYIVSTCQSRCFRLRGQRPSCRSTTFCHLPWRYRSGAYVCRSHQKSRMSLLLLDYRQLRSVRGTLTSDTIIALVNALIHVGSTIAIAFWLERPTSTCGSCKVLNAAARLIARRRKFDSISSTIRDVLHWLPIRQRVDFKLCMPIYLPP